MKFIKTGLISVIIFAVCILLFACAGEQLVENDRTDKASVGEWSFGSWAVTSSPMGLGVPFYYEFEDATIEIKNSSEDAIIIVLNESDIISGWSTLSDYVYYSGCKKVTYGESVSVYSKAGLQWASCKDWWDWQDGVEEELGDYITFIARKGNNIVGYSVAYLHTDGSAGSGEVLADKEFPQVNGEYQKVSERAVNEKINSIINAHKKTK